MPHAYIIIREFMPSSESISTSYSIRTTPHAVYHLLDNAKSCLKELSDAIIHVEPQWTVEVSHTRQERDDVLTGFTVLDKRRMVAQVAFIEKVEIGDECESQGRSKSEIRERMSRWF
jgi:hypothetical protein